MIKAVVLEVFVDEDSVLPLDAAAQQPDEVRVLGFRNALDFSYEFLDPLLGFRTQNLCSKCGAISPYSLCYKNIYTVSSKNLSLLLSFFL